MVEYFKESSPASSNENFEKKGQMNLHKNKKHTINRKCHSTPPINWWLIYHKNGQSIIHKMKYLIQCRKGQPPLPRKWRNNITMKGQSTFPTRLTNIQQTIPRNDFLTFLSIQGRVIQYSY